jgi:putative tryptophan/tyrosine transport system substrate-binding protein
MGRHQGAREAVPSGSRFAVVTSPAGPAPQIRSELENAAKEYVEMGGLIAYTADMIELRRRAATFVHKILEGAKPADLPVGQPSRFELVINLKTAQALGLTIPPLLLFQADEVLK